MLTENPPEGCGLYFLIRDDAIVYVGSSDYPSKRVWTHRQCRKKDFDHVLYLGVGDNEALVSTEKHWIAKLCPVHNKQFNPKQSIEHDGWGDSLTEGLVVTFRLTGDLRLEFERFLNRQRVAPPKSEVIAAALREFFTSVYEDTYE